jgi:hypothetical protein
LEATSRDLNKKKLTNIIAGMHGVGIKDEVKDCLGMPLLHVAGSERFADMKTVNGVSNLTYREAAFHRRLLASDEE